MKKSVLIIIIFLLITNVNAIKVITGETISGKATQYQTNISITILSLPINISVFSPQNKTYIQNSSILINYSSPNALSTWYNLDGSQNLTLTQTITFSITQGPHTLNIYANNSDSVVTNSSLNFHINSSLLTILYEEYLGANKGNSTYFEEYAYEDLQNLSNIILENTNSGKIKFNQNINVTLDSNFLDRIVDLDYNTNISANRIELNSINLPNFNKSATLWLYGLNYSLPQVLKDSSNCTSCKIESYSGGTLKFNVTSFSIYSAKETLASSQAPSPSRGSGGGSSSIVTPVIEIEYPFPQEDLIIKTGTLSLIMRQGETEIEKISLYNKGNKTIKIRIYALNITKYVNINEIEFEIAPYVSKNITLEFIIPPDLFPDIYLGKIAIISENYTQEIPISINVITPSPDLEVTTKIQKKYLQIKPGKEIEGIITINNFEDVKGTAELEYGMLNENGEIIISFMEEIQIENLLQIIKQIKIPSGLKPGNYLFYAKVKHKGLIYSSSSWFYIRKKSMLPYTIAVCAVIGTVILYFLFRKKKKKVKKSKQKKTK